MPVAPRRQYCSGGIADRKEQREDETCDAGVQSVGGKTEQRAQGERFNVRSFAALFGFLTCGLPAPIQRRRQQYAHRLNRL